MTTTRTIASNLAKTIASTDWVPAGVETPIVALDGLAGQLDIGGHPLVVVTARNTAGWKSPEHVVEVLVGVDASSALAGNPSQSTPGPDGVLRYGAGGLLDEVARLLVALVRESNPGAILDSYTIDFTYDSTPKQYAEILFNYHEIAVYGD